MIIDTFTGGIFDTNCYFLPESGLLIDAPQSAAEWLTETGRKVRLLLLTHGHIDHAWDAAQIQREHGCPVACHPDTVPLVTERDFFKKFGMMWEIEPVRVDQLLEESSEETLGGVRFQIFLVPGHCPGSLCFYQKEENVLFGGDVLFAGSIGRTDLPGGDHEVLLTGIRTKLFTLDDDVTVLSGHGPATKIGRERRYNPYVGEEA
jgi:glyoxylase-like metal-dependent hydrolase (beta-lactamase superfamily II)